MLKQFASVRASLNSEVGIRNYVTFDLCASELQIGDKTNMQDFLLGSHVDLMSVAELRAEEDLLDFLS